MSRYTVYTSTGQEVAYGFDHAVGPFLQIFDAEGDCVEDIDYFFTRSFDCHKLAERLTGLVDVVEGDVRLLRAHIHTLWMDLPI